MASTPQEIQQKHKQQKFWQILFPIILATLLVVTAMVWVILGSTQNAAGTAALSQAATVVVVLPWFLIFLVGLVLIVGLIYGLGKLHGVIPGATQVVMSYLLKAKDYMTIGADATTKPIMTLQKLSAQAEQAVTSFTERFSKE